MVCKGQDKKGKHIFVKNKVFESIYTYFFKVFVFVLILFSQVFKYLIQIFLKISICILYLLQDCHYII